MHITGVLIQKQSGEFVSANGYAAWRGFTDRGFSVSFFEWPELRDGAVPLDGHNIVVGGAGTVIHALKALGVETPTVEDLPEALAAFRGRRVRHSTLGQIRRDCEAGGGAVFVKPLRSPKAFVGAVVAGQRDLRPMLHLPDEMDVLVSEPVEFRSEWRFFVLRGKVVGAGCYLGDPLLFPDQSVLTDAVAAWTSHAPAGYGIDLGVTADGRTLLVEVNDGYSLGCLGLRPHIYSQILESRWVELVGRYNPR